jgi:hypothetical protein
MPDLTNQPEPDAVITITLTTTQPGVEIRTHVAPNSGLGLAAARSLSDAAREAGQQMGHVLSDATRNPNIARA